MEKELFLPSITIRNALERDFPGALALIHELALYEKEPQEVEVGLEEFKASGLKQSPDFHLTVAVNEAEKVIGMALYYLSYSTWKGRIVYLDDLVITEKYRRMGIGRQLLQRVFKFAEQNNVRQLRWHVLDWNKPAIQLYKKLGMKLESEWITCKLTNRQIQILANESI